MIIVKKEVNFRNLALYRQLKHFAFNGLNMGIV
jgi:hypothetical protein